MQINRTGAIRVNGSKKLLPRKDEKFYYEDRRGNDRSANIRALRHRVVADDLRTQHDYWISMSLKEVVSLIPLLANEVYEKDNGELAELLAPHAADLQRLMMCLQGYPHPAKLNQNAEV